jgi:hypothetical protein
LLALLLLTDGAYWIGNPVPRSSAGRGPKIRRWDS